MKFKVTLVSALLALMIQPAAAEPAAGSSWTEPSTDIEFIYIPAGCFDMGSSDGTGDEMPIHNVCVKGFYLGRYEVTQAQYQALAGKNPSKFSGSNNPVERVSFNDIHDVLEEFNYQNRGNYRLPSEAEWEYACRAGGQHSQYCGAGGIDKLAWYSGNSDQQTHGVGQKRANAWGLYDMSGNVWEWVEDCYHNNYNGAPTDGSAWKGGGDCGVRMLRGGSWYFEPEFARAAIRDHFDPAKRSLIDGFRLARTLP